MELDGKWSDLETRGFVVLRSLLSDEETKVQAQHYAAAARSKIEAYYTAKALAELVAPVHDRIAALLPEITQSTSILADAVKSGGGYFPTEHTALGWHTDFLTDYVNQGAYHYLNFWIPVIKPDPTRSGLAIVPMDRLAREIPRAFELSLGRGAASYQRDRFVFDRDGQIIEVPSMVGPDALCEIPTLRVGDALVVRGDVFHRTQDVETHRVALSIRAVRRGQVLKKSILLTTSEKKYKRMLLEKNTFIPILAAFWLTRQEQMSLGQVLDMVEDFQKKAVWASPSKLSVYLMAKVFYRLVLWHRHRAHRIKAPLTGESTRHA
jgi:hypothetical protein